MAVITPYFVTKCKRMQKNFTSESLVKSRNRKKFCRKRNFFVDNSE